MTDRLVSVTEPDPANQPGGTLTTSYTYDWMNHLSGVTMPRSSATQTRSFVYDDAGRLTSATNPENGTVLYYYNSTNTLQYKHDAKGQDTVYTYDTQNRVTEIQRYANGKNNAEDMCQRVTYSYDTNPYDSTGKYQYTTGRLTAAVYPVCNVLDSNGNVSVTEMYSYHPAGGVTIKDLHIYKPWWNSAYGNWSDGWGDVEADYAFNPAGQTSSLVLPSTLVPSGCCASVIQPVTYTYGYDGMARPASMVDNNPNSNNGYSTTWAQNVQYDFAGRLTNWQRHTGGNNFDTNVAETLGYNVNSQLTSMSWSYQDPTFGSWGAASGIQYVYSAGNNNGQITQAVESWSGQNISYQYDALKRLISAASTTTGSGAPAAWTETMQYDGFGNLTAKVLNGATTSIPVNAATNRLSNASYDANGNMISGAGATLGYDEANRIVSAAEYSGGTEYYAYAPDGKRMFRMEADGVTQEWTFWGARGEKLGTFAMVYNPYVGNSTHPYQPVLNPTLSFAGKTIWDGGKPLVQDRVGTNRATGARYYPFGDEITSTANDAVKFGTYHRDGFTGLDYADQRFYASTYGRFNTPDPDNGGDTGNPVSMNLYHYSLGDPINFNDPLGTDPITLPPLQPTNDPTCVGTLNIWAESNFGLNYAQYLNTDSGLLGITSFFEDEGSFSAGSTTEATKTKTWAAIDWTFLDQSNLSPSQAAAFFGPNNIPSSFSGILFAGSQVWSNGTLKQGFLTQLINILNGTVDNQKSQSYQDCNGLFTSLDTARNAIQTNSAANGLSTIPGYTPVTNPFPGSLQFASGGKVPGHGPGVREVSLGSSDGFTFYEPVPVIRRPIPTPPVRRRR